MGRVAQELRDYQQAKADYQQALAIWIQFGDRYSQAATYHQLGIVAEELGELEEAKANYLQDLQIMAEFNDKHRLSISFRNLTRFYQATQDESFLAAAAQIFGTTAEELKQAILSNGES